MITFALILMTLYAWSLVGLVWVLQERIHSCVCQCNPIYDTGRQVAFAGGFTLIVFAAILKTNGVWL